MSPARQRMFEGAALLMCAVLFVGCYHLPKGAEQATAADVTAEAGDQDDFDSTFVGPPSYEQAVREVGWKISESEESCNPMEREEARILRRCLRIMRDRHALEAEIEKQEDRLLEFKFAQVRDDPTCQARAREIEAVISVLRQQLRKLNGDEILKP